MASLHIKSFGPIVDSTRIELTPLMVLIGRQSAGKSTFMKVLCFCRWIEKKIMVSTDDIVNQYTHYNRFVKELKQFHRLNDEFFTDDTHLMYDGDNITIKYHGVNGNAQILRKKSFAEKRFNTKLCYIPAERMSIKPTKPLNAMSCSTSSTNGMRQRFLTPASILSSWPQPEDSVM